MALTSVQVNANSDPLTILNALVANDVANEANRIKMQGELVAAKVWKDNETSTAVYIRTIFGDSLTAIPEVTLDFVVPEDNYYRVVFAMPAVLGTTATTDYYVAVADNNLPPGTASIAANYFWGYTQYPQRRNNSTNVFPPVVVQFDKWLITGRTYSISGLVFGTFGSSTVSVAAALTQRTTVVNTAYIAVYKSGSGVA